MKQRDQNSALVQETFKPAVQNLARTWTTFRTRIVENAISFSGGKITAKTTGARVKEEMCEVVGIVVVSVPASY